MAGTTRTRSQRGATRDEKWRIRLSKKHVEGRGKNERQRGVKRGGQDVKITPFRTKRNKKKTNGAWVKTIYKFGVGSRSFLRRTAQKRLGKVDMKNGR